ncbi:MAG TPA: hypothetical protein GXZ24_02570 [Firmicutes bacterium]|jgi:hypothetical protein|nr:hypothetical protein [Bacillota bacterium]
MITGREFLHGSTTGIGSMPHRDVAAALSLIRENMPLGPHWPQLPGLGGEESFARQYLAPLLKLNILGLKKGEAPFFYDLEEDWPEREQAFYELYLDALENEQGEKAAMGFFAFPREAARGFYAFLEGGWSSREGTKPLFVKGQISGPLSLGLQINSADGKAAFYHPGLRDILVKNLALQAKSQVRALKKFSLPVIIFIDEPALLSFGQSAYTALASEDISAALEEIIFAIKEEGAMVGVHSCAGIDWSIPFNLPLDIVNFDAYEYFDSLLVYAEEMDAFLKKGGILAWGLIPTSEAIEEEETAVLKERFLRGIERLANRGVGADLLKKQYMLTPSCGTGTLAMAQAEKVYRLTSELQAALKQI